ncbi:interleukin-7 receptor subunit alpha [Arapaima gigas]
MGRWYWVVVLFILSLSLVVAESGGGDEDPFEFCYSSLRINQVSLTCELEDDLVEEVTSVKLCPANNNNVECAVPTVKEKNITFKNLNVLLTYDLKVNFKRKEPFSNKYFLRQIIKPDPPRIASAEFLTISNQAVIIIETGYHKDYLENNLNISVLIRNSTTAKIHDIVDKNFVIEGMYLKEDTVYYVQARTKPRGDYFQGCWSEWSASGRFRTLKGPKSPELHRKPSVWLLVVIFVPLSLFMILALAVIRWHNEIISVIWPSIPNPKNTLVQAYKPKKGPPVSFNPEVFFDSNIHLIDRVEETRPVPEVSDESGNCDLRGHNSSQTCTGPFLRNSTACSGEGQPMLQSSTGGEEEELNVDKFSPTAGIPGNQDSSNGAKSMPIPRREEAYVTMSSFYKSQ